MWLILISLAVGIIIGLFQLIPPKCLKWNAKFQQSGVILLLFSMGASIGANKEIIGNLRNMGVQAAVFATLTSICSITAVYIISKVVLLNKRRDV